MTGARIKSVTPEAVAEAAGIIRDGGVVAFPTETYYGLAVDPWSETALDLLFEVKDRPPSKPILTLVHAQEQLSLLVEEIPPVFEPLIRRFWPGPLTLLFQARRSLPSRLTGGSGTIGVRISSQPAAQQLVGVFGRPLTATSANLSGRQPATTAGEVAAQLGAKVALILDGGKTAGGRPSTIVGVQAGQLLLVREGMVGCQELQQAAGMHILQCPPE